MPNSNPLKHPRVFNTPFAIKNGFKTEERNLFKAVFDKKEENVNVEEMKNKSGTYVIKVGIASSLRDRDILKAEGGFSTDNLTVRRAEGLAHLKRFRPIMSRSRRRQVLQNHPELQRMFRCNSKVNLIQIFHAISTKMKKMIKLYLERGFLLHLHLRQLKNLSKLMAQRQCIYRAVDQPDVLKGNVNFANNLVKNFCKGVVNFVVLFYDDLKRNDCLPGKPGD